MVYKDWEWKIGNKKEQKQQRLEKKRAGHNAWRVIDDITTKFFVTNFPPDTSPATLRRLCSKFGRVVDVYIHKQLSQQGKKFAFVKFLNINSDQDKLDMVAKLRTIWINKFHLFASVERFGRKNDPKVGKDRAGHVNTGPSQQGGKLHKKEHDKGGASYAAVVKGGTKTLDKVVAPVHKPAVFELPDDCTVSIGEFPLNRLVAIKDPMVIKSFPKICREEGFDVDVRYVGGRWILLTFTSEMAVEGFQKCVSIMNLVNEIREVVDTFVVNERLLWVDVRGLPACAWNDNSIRHIVERWGELMFFEEDVNYPLASRRVCIAYNKNEVIDEDLRILIKKKEFIVKVKQLTEWEVVFYDDEAEREEDRDSDSLSDRVLDLDIQDDLSGTEVEAEAEEHHASNGCLNGEKCMDDFCDSNFRMEGPYACGVTERKKKNKASKSKYQVINEDLIKNLFGSNSSLPDVGKVNIDRSGTEESSKPKSPPAVASGHLHEHKTSSNSQDSSTGNPGHKLGKEVFQPGEVSRLMELGKILGVSMGSQDEVHQKLVSMGVLHVDQ